MTMHFPCYTPTKWVFAALLACLAVFAPNQAQSTEHESFAKLSAAEEELADLTSRFYSDDVMDSIINDSTIVGLIRDSIAAHYRQEAVWKFIPAFVSALKQPGSFYYPFSKLEQVSVLYPPDSTFRIITWQLIRRMGTYKYYGVIQLASEDLKLIPLTDMSDTFSYHKNDVLSADNWLGAYYYNILQHEVNGKSYYTLFGYDANDFWGSRKILEVMSFKGDKPVFGAPMFHFTDSMGNTTFKNRFYLDYRHNANVRMNYDANMDMIVYDHTAPTKELYRGIYFAYIPDGTYEAFKWENDHWQWVEKVFHFSINENDNPPRPHPIFDD